VVALHVGQAPFFRPQVFSLALASALQAFFRPGVWQLLAWLTLGVQQLAPVPELVLVLVLVQAPQQQPQVRTAQQPVPQSAPARMQARPQQVPPQPECWLLEPRVLFCHDSGPNTRPRQRAQKQRCLQ
jgi:hypothetical protein